MNHHNYEKKQEQNYLTDFQEIYDTHHEEILHYLLKHTPTPEDAWDLLQDIFLKLFQTLNKAEGNIKQARGFL